MGHIGLVKEKLAPQALIRLLSLMESADLAVRELALESINNLLVHSPNLATQEVVDALSRTGGKVSFAQDEHWSWQPWPKPLRQTRV